MFGPTSSPGVESLSAGTTPAQISGYFQLVCTNGLAAHLEVSPGSHGVDGATPTRYIANGANQIQYQMYRDAAKTQPWGDTAGTNTYDFTGNGTTVVYYFYVNINTPTLASPAGTYSDAVAVTVAY